jgi:hypothetical protein
LLAAAIAAVVGLGGGSTSTAAQIARSTCTAAQAQSTVSAFVTAYNRGDLEALDSIFASSPAFRWYSSNRPGTRVGSEARRRDNLIGYFRGRHRAGDRLGLVSFQFNGNSNAYGNFGLAMRRALPRFRGGDWFRTEAKGAALCTGADTRLIVMSIGGPVPTVR